MRQAIGMEMVYQGVSLKSHAVRVGLVVACFALLYADLLGGLAQLWWEINRLEAFLIPFLSLYLVWLKREHLKQIEPTPSLSWGLPTMILAAVLLLVGHVGGINTLEETSFLLMVVALVLMLLGTAFLKALWLPIAYLTFMLTISQELVSPLHWPLQLLTAQKAAALLQLMGIPAFVERQYISLPNLTLEVAWICSGASYLTSIVVIGIPLALLTLSSWWARAALVLSAIAIGIAANWLRVALIGFWAYGGHDTFHGPYHILQGMFVAWIGYGALFVGSWGLSRWERAGSPRPIEPPGRPLTRGRPALGSSPEWNRAWALAIMPLLALLAYLAWQEPTPVRPAMELATFPFKIGSWTGSDDELQNALLRVPSADHELLRVYRSPEGSQIQLYVAYFESQRQKKEMVSDRTRALHAHTNGFDAWVGPGHAVRVNRGRYGDPSAARNIVFWYDVDGQTIADRYEAKLMMTLNALWSGRSNGALVLLAGSPVEEAGPGGVEAIEEAFLEQAFSALRSRLTD